MQRSNVMTTDRSRQSLTMRMRMMLMMMLVMMMLMAPQGVQAQSTCTAVEDMNSRMTYVTCHFEQGISQDDFNVQFFSSDGSTQETALACNHHESDSLNCHKATGVEFDEHQKKPYHLTFARNAALSPAGSKYKCQRVPSVAEETAEKCTVGEIDVPEVPEPTSPEADTEGSGASAAVFILLFIVIIIVVAVGICCALAYVRRDRISKWVTMHTIGQLGPEDLKDPEKPISRDPKMPEGWPVFFFNMGWREAEKGEENKDKGTASSQSSRQQPQSKAGKQDPELDLTLVEDHFVQPLLTARSWSPPRTPSQQHPQCEDAKQFTERDVNQEEGHARTTLLADKSWSPPRTTPPPKVRRSNSCHGPKKAGSHAGRRPASLHDENQETIAGRSGEPPEGDTFFDAKDDTEEASITPGKKEMKKLQAAQAAREKREQEAQKKAEKDRVTKEKEAAEQKAKETIQNAKSAAKRITEEAKDKPKEEKKKAKSEADKMIKDAEELAKQMKKTAGKGDKDVNQKTTTTV